ncbi:T9SS type A sorting domain-containing protein, partial [Candidatus Bipolaricaulota bacterium]|nr:T9SS type A sorting domain-containing protein [Candidatus Bipolaricaulota bacterium]
MDPKTGAYIVWISYQVDDPGGGLPAVAPFDQYYDSATYIPFQGHDPGNPGSLQYDFLEETGPDTGLFTSKRAFQVGTRENFAQARLNTHVVDNNVHPNPNLNADNHGAPGVALTTWLQDFQWGGYEYFAGVRDYLDASPAASALLTMPWADLVDPVLPAARTGVAAVADYLVGRFENMDTLTGLYVDQNDPKDVACVMAKIVDIEATCSWDQEIYKDANGSASITIVDPDENVNCNVAEWVPVFVIVNPGSWNPVDFVQTPAVVGVSPTTFCALKRTGGVDPTGMAGLAPAAPLINAGAGQTIMWWNIYNSNLAAMGIADINNAQVKPLGAYYIEYPTTIDVPLNVVTFDTVDANGIVRCMWWAQETGVNTGVFQLNFNSLLRDLGFNSLDVCDVLVAYYLDPNDEDDMTLCTAYIESRECASLTSFTDATRAEMNEYWLGRDPIYVQVIDSNANVDSCCPEQVVVHICNVHADDDTEWVILDETSSNSPVFFTMNGYQLLAIWDALGVGRAGNSYQLILDNWVLEAYNEDSIYARYNDVYYVPGRFGLAGLGDSVAVSTINTAAPPQIRQIRVENDVSFDLMEVMSTEVFDFGGTTNMWFLDRQGNRVSGYVNSDCVFVEVLDLDQDEDQYRRERIDGYWDNGPNANNRGQNYPFGPVGAAAAPWGGVHPVIPGAVLPSSRVNFMLGNNNPWDAAGLDTHPKLYILNPRTGNWQYVDLLENGVASGDFVSTTCIDLVSQYALVPTLGVLPGDTIIAVYQDPSNHSDSAWISIKVGCGGGGTPPGQASTTDFVDAQGNSVANYTDADDAYVKVIDPSHAGADTLTGLEVEGIAYDLSYLEGANTDTFITEAIPMADLGAVAGDEITANYTDATDPLDTSTDTVPIISSELVFEGFIAKPNPFSDEVTFTFEGAGIPETFAVTVYNMSGHLVWSEELSNVTEIVWDG